MTGSRAGQVVALDDKRTGNVNDEVMCTVIVTVNDAVMSLSRTARTHEFDSPNVAAHIRKLSQQIAGSTLDALRTWPATEE